MVKISHALIMAAGRGLRMMPLTNEIPKAMAIHEGGTLIANSIGKLKKTISNIHITVGYKGSMLAKHVIEQNISSVINTNGKGNSWWIFNSLLKNLNEPILVLTCDNIVEIDTDLILQDYLDKGSPACMVIPVIPIQGLEGDYIFHTNGLINELNRSKKSDIYCSGIQVINPFLINQMMEEKNDFNLLWKELISRKQLYCSSVYPKNWFTVDTLDQLNFINK